MSFNFESLNLTEIIRLQNQLSALLARRFKKTHALAFSDVTGSTAYFARFGNEAGRGLQQRHVDLIATSLEGSSGRIVDTVGDGVFVCFPDVETALEILGRFQTIRLQENDHFPQEHHMTTRIGIHWGTVLTDGVIVTGDPVNLCAKLAATAQPSEIRITKPAFLELTLQRRLRCRPIGPVKLAGVNEPMDIFGFCWADPVRFPVAVLIAETGEQLPLPPQPVITFGRLREMNGTRANDIVLTHKDPSRAQHISRWHFEIRRTPEGLILRSVSTQPTEVNGKTICKGEETSISAGTVVRLADVLTLRFIADSSDQASEDNVVTTVT